MWIQRVLAHTEGQIAATSTSGHQMYEWMMGGGTGSAWGWMMMGGMMLFGILIIVALALLIVWLVKEIKK